MDSRWILHPPLSTLDNALELRRPLARRYGRGWGWGCRGGAGGRGCVGRRWTWLTRRQWVAGMSRRRRGGPVPPGTGPRAWAGSPPMAGCARGGARTAVYRVPGRRASVVHLCRPIIGIQWHRRPPTRRCRSPDGLRDRGAPGRTSKRAVGGGTGTMPPGARWVPFAAVRSATAIGHGVALPPPTSLHLRSRHVPAGRRPRLPGVLRLPIMKSPRPAETSRPSKWASHSMAGASGHSVAAGGARSSLRSGGGVESRWAHADGTRWPRQWPADTNIPSTTGRGGGGSGGGGARRIEPVGSLPMPSPPSVCGPAPGYIPMPAATR